MGFWIFMLICELLIPLSMVGFGKYFINTAPKNINMLFGYRTPMSTKNKDTWIFAHHYFGKLWYKSGLVLLPVSVIVMLLVLGKEEDPVGYVGAALCYVQMAVMLIPIFFTERALKRTFDKEGKRRADNPENTPQG